jgi:hypothetical protein
MASEEFLNRPSHVSGKAYARESIEMKTYDVNFQMSVLKTDGNHV